MAYDEELAARVRGVLAREPDLSERRMFGGLAFLLGGHMAVAASGQGAMMVRADPDDTESLTSHAGVEPMEMRGRPMKGWLLVADEAVSDDDQLARWVGVGVSYVRTLPPKSP